MPDYLDKAFLKHQVVFDIDDIHVLALPETIGFGEFFQREQVADDAALLLRCGAPLSLATLPGIRREAEQRAVSDCRLRRFLPGGVKSSEHVGIPAVRASHEREK